jgi:hypothetical protein
VWYSNLAKNKKKNVFLNRSSTINDTLIPSSCQCVETRSIEIVWLLARTFPEPPFQHLWLSNVLQRISGPFPETFTRPTLPAVNIKHFFMSILCIESFIQKKTKNAEHRYSVVYPSSTVEHFHHWNRPVIMPMRVCYLDPHEAGLCCYLVRKSVTSITSVILPFLTYLLTLPCIWWVTAWKWTSDPATASTALTLSPITMTEFIVYDEVYRSWEQIHRRRHNTRFCVCGRGGGAYISGAGRPRGDIFRNSPRGRSLCESVLRRNLGRGHITETGNRNYPELLSTLVEHMLLNGVAQMQETATHLAEKLNNSTSKQRNCQSSYNCVAAWFPSLNCSVTRVSDSCVS